jgi:hypothetical protein
MYRQRKWKGGEKAMRTCFIASVLALVSIGVLALTQTAAEERKFSTPAYEISHYALVPLRAITEWLGATVEYDSGHIVVALADRRVELDIGKKSATINGESTELPVAPRLIKGTAYVPVRMLAEGLGAQVEYERAGPTVIIRRAEQVARFAVKPYRVQKKRPGTYKKRRRSAAWQHYYETGCTGMLEGRCKHRGD